MELEEAKQILEDELVCRPCGDQKVLEAIRVVLDELRNNSK